MCHCTLFLNRLTLTHPICNIALLLFPQQTPLHLSVLTCQAIIVEFLIFHGACVNKRDRNGQTALHLASKNADIECVKAIKHATESPRYSADYADEKPDLSLKNFEGN